ncbi:MAG: hypothetical protein Tsb0010_19910 [Parvularculaceae bacterium]
MSRLKTILRLNAASCFGFGALFALAPASVAAFLSDTPAPGWLILALGLGLLANGAHLVLAASRAKLRAGEVLHFAIGDFLWVAATIALIVFGVWITTPAGIEAALAVALMVGAFGGLQIVGLQKMRRASSPAI